MKTEIVENKNESFYPKLKVLKNKHMNVVVLFTSKNSGVTLYSDNTDEEVGSFCDDWIEVDFIDFHGIIQIKN